MALQIQIQAASPSQCQQRSSQLSNTTNNKLGAYDNLLLTSAPHQAIGQSTDGMVECDTGQFSNDINRSHGNNNSQWNYFIILL